MERTMQTLTNVFVSKMTPSSVVMSWMPPIPWWCPSWLPVPWWWPRWLPVPLWCARQLPVPWWCHSWLQVPLGMSQMTPSSMVMSTSVIQETPTYVVSFQESSTSTIVRTQETPQSILMSQKKVFVQFQEDSSVICATGKGAEKRTAYKNWRIKRIFGGGVQKSVSTIPHHNKYIQLIVI